MNSKPTNKTLSLLVLLATLCLVPVQQVFAHAGVVIFANGEVYADPPKGDARKLSRGVKVHPGDIIRTGKDSQVQIRTGDGSMLSLQANSSLRIIEHKHTGEVDEQNSLVELVKGGMRAVTGLIGKNKPENFKIKVKGSTIGIRGTEFVIQLCENDCDLDPDKKRKNLAKNGVYVGVLSGTITVERKEQKIELDSSLNMVLGVSMGIDEKKKQYVYIGDREDAKVEALPKPPEVILQALAPPPVKLTPAELKKPRQNSLPMYSGIDNELMKAHMAATQPAEKSLSPIEEFEQLAYPAEPDVMQKNRFIYPVHYGVDPSDSTFHNLTNQFP
ncbi:MAG: FecR family protein [Gammaproteobacteria bacterium]|nr:FecR family protein [Gammaproteobacteria bacterium]MDH5652461.1 FecR family protein [Gammaproteobacteria bacterium]